MFLVLSCTQSARNRTYITLPPPSPPPPFNQGPPIFSLTPPTHALSPPSFSLTESHIVQRSSSADAFSSTCPYLQEKGEETPPVFDSPCFSSWNDFRSFSFWPCIFFTLKLVLESTHDSLSSALGRLQPDTLRSTKQWIRISECVDRNAQICVADQTLSHG